MLPDPLPLLPLPLKLDAGPLPDNGELELNVVLKFGAKPPPTGLAGPGPVASCGGGIEAEPGIEGGLGVNAPEYFKPSFVRLAAFPIRLPVCAAVGAFPCAMDWKVCKGDAAPPAAVAAAVPAAPAPKAPPAANGPTPPAAAPIVGAAAAMAARAMGMTKGISGELLQLGSYAETLERDRRCPVAARQELP